MGEKGKNMSVVKWVLNFGCEGKCDALNEQTSCLTRNDPGSSFSSNTFVSAVRECCSNLWELSISLLLLQNPCRGLTGLYSLNWQIYLSSVGLDGNISYSEAVPLEEGSSSPRKSEHISFKGPACHPLSGCSQSTLPSPRSLGGPLPLTYVFVALHITFSNLHV